METKIGTKTFMGNRRLLVSATVLIASILLLAGFGLIMAAHAETSDSAKNAHVEGTFTTQRSYINAPFPTIPSPYALTLIDYNTVSASYSNGVLVGKADNLNSLAVDSTGMGRATGTGTFWGTVGGSSPGLYSFIDTFTIDTTTPTAAPVNGNLVIVQGSGLGGLAGICGIETFQGTVDLATGAGSFTFDLAAQFGSSCHSTE